MSWDRTREPSWSLTLPEEKWIGHFVYVAWGATKRGRPVYVGCSSSLRARVAWHLTRAPWAQEVGSFDFYRFDSAEDAYEAESLAIEALNPRHNLTRNRPPFRGIDQQQLAIIARVQNRGRMVSWGDA